jgi:hypothetical protein
MISIHAGIGHPNPLSKNWTKAHEVGLVNFAVASWHSQRCFLRSIKTWMRRDRRANDIGLNSALREGVLARVFATEFARNDAPVSGGKRGFDSVDTEMRHLFQPAHSNRRS